MVEAVDGWVVFRDAETRELFYWFEPKNRYQWQAPGRLRRNRRFNQMIEDAQEEISKIKGENKREMKQLAGALTVEKRRQAEKLQAVRDVTRMSKVSVITRTSHSDVQ